MQAPEPFLNVRVHRLEIDPSISGLCVGYENGQWRASEFARHLTRWLPEFALTYSEIEGLHSGNMVDLICEAAKKVYATEKFRNRGEFGELLLHAAMRQIFNSSPAISKIYYKSARNDTVKGFDAVHVVGDEEGFELWLGEAKFYTDITAAIRDVIAELHAHIDVNYLRDEFLLIKGKIDDDWPYADRLKALISRNNSLDNIFRAIRIPVLLTYNSACVANFDHVCEAYNTAFREEIMRNYGAFVRGGLPENISIRLFLLPLNTKEILINDLDERLRLLQNI